MSSLLDGGKIRTQALKVRLIEEKLGEKAQQDDVTSAEQG